MGVDLYPVQLSFFVASVATAVALALGTGAGWALARLRFPGRELADAIVSLPLVLPPTVLGYYLLVLLGRRSSIGRVYESIVGSPITFTVTAAVIAAVLHALPLIAKSARAAFQETPAELEQAARTLGSSEWRVFRTVTLPLARRALVAAGVLGFARALGDFGVTIMIAGNIPGRTQTASVAIYDAVQAGRDDQALMLVSVVMAVSIVILYATNRLGGRVL